MTEDSIEFTPLDPFSRPLSGDRGLPRVYGSLARYVQGPGIFAQAGHYIGRLGFTYCAVLLSRRSEKAEGGLIIKSLQAAGIETEIVHFHGECSRQEINGHTSRLKDLDRAIDGVVAIGGGKVVDAGRAIANRLGVGIAVAPTLASNDAPGASISVIYTPEGATENAELYDRNPELVIIDSDVVAKAGPRYLAAGIGDALATWYEARATAKAAMGVNIFGGRPTLAGLGIAELAGKIVFEYGLDAMETVRDNKVSQSLENIVEANTLLSGLGYENGGLALSHAVAQGYTLVDHVHNNFLHGEMVAMGIMAQLAAENDIDEAQKAGHFMAAIGLPVTLEAFSLEAQSPELDAVIAGVMAFPFLSNMAVEITPDSVRQAIIAADKIGRSLG